MKIARVQCVDVGFSRRPATLKRNLVTNASLFEDFETKPDGWFGPVVCTVVEVETADGAVGIGSAGAFHNGARSLIETYYTDLVVGEDPRRHEHLWQRLKQRFGFGPRQGPEGMHRDVALVRTVRDAVGMEIELAADILQPDANRAGGITELRKICAMAEAAGLPVIPHSNEPHNLAIVFSQPAHVCPVIEFFPDVEPDTGNELFWRLYKDVPQARDGYPDLDPRPGLGVDLDREAVRQLEHRASPPLAPTAT